VVKVKKGSGLTAHWSIDFSRLIGWLRRCFTLLITPLDIDGIGQNWEDSIRPPGGAEGAAPCASPGWGPRPTGIGFPATKRPTTGRQGTGGGSHRARRLVKAFWRLKTAFQSRNRPRTRRLERRGGQGGGPVAGAAWTGLLDVWNLLFSHVTGFEQAVRRGRCRATYPTRRGRVARPPPLLSLTQIDEVRVMLQLRERWVSHRRMTHRVICYRHVLDMVFRQC